MVSGVYVVALSVPHPPLAYTQHDGLSFLVNRQFSCKQATGDARLEI